MANELLDRLERVAGKLLEQNRQLRQEKADWLREKAALLQEIEQILSRLEALDLEETE